MNLEPSFWMKIFLPYCPFLQSSLLGYFGCLFFMSSTVFTSFLLFGEMVIMTKCKMFAANTGFQYFSVEAHFRNIF